MSTSVWFGLLTSLVFASVARGQRSATSTEFPFQVSIQNASNKAHLCGGVIITSKWILTVKDCAQKSTSVLVGYGSADSNQPNGTTSNRRIIYEKEVPESSLALIELENEIIFTENVKQARLPTKDAEFKSFKVKISGWKTNNLGHKHPTLNAIDKYHIEFQNCSRGKGIPVRMNPDQFCGYDPEFPDYFALRDLGTAVSKDGIIIGLISKNDEDSLVSPMIFTKVSEYGEWIKNILGGDGDALSWVDTIPKDSADSVRLSGLVFSVVFFCLARFI